MSRLRASASISPRHAPPVSRSGSPGGGAEEVEIVSITSAPSVTAAGSSGSNTPFPNLALMVRTIAPPPFDCSLWVSAKCQYLPVTLNAELLESVKIYRSPRERRPLRPSAAFRKALSSATVPFGDPVARSHRPRGHGTSADREVVALGHYLVSGSSRTLASACHHSFHSGDHESSKGGSSRGERTQVRRSDARLQLRGSRQE